MDIKQIQSLCCTEWLGQRIYFKDEIDSTNQWAKQTMDTARRGDVFLAGYQTAGRGRLDRTWESSPQKNILMSFMDQPPSAEDCTYQLTFVAGVAFVKSLENLFPNIKWKLKWPNDILVSGKKIAGILCEYHPSTKRVIIGVGVNVNSTEFSSNIQSQATSLYMLTGKEHSLEKLIAACLASYEKWRKIYDERGLAPIINVWNTLDALLGKNIRVNSPPHSIEGIVEKLDNDGFLLVRTRERLHQIISGDILIL